MIIMKIKMNYLILFVPPFQASYMFFFLCSHMSWHFLSLLLEISRFHSHFLFYSLSLSPSISDFSLLFIIGKQISNLN